MAEKNVTVSPARGARLSTGLSQEVVCEVISDREREKPV